MPKQSSVRIDWVDTAKGFCIILVVMMHSSYGVELAMGGEGWTHSFAEFARPFRMPDFFLISGLFLARVIDRDWRRYLDKKLVHFIYFYVLWLTIQSLVKAVYFSGTPVEAFQSYLISFVQPFGTMWFIYLLPIFFIITKLMRPISPLLVFGLAAGLEILDINTGWVVADEFAGRYVYFFLGYWLAPYIFSTAAWLRARPVLALSGLAGWAVLNGTLVFSGWSQLPFISLMLGALGAAAIVSMAVLLTDLRGTALLRYAGENSIVIYLAFFLPMAATRIVLVKTGWVMDIGTVTLMVTAAGVMGPLMLHAVLRKMQIGMFLFVRPGWAILPAKPDQALPVRAELGNIR